MTNCRTGNELALMLGALANPHRMRIMAELSAGQEYVSELARKLGMSRPLLYMHLRMLENAGLVVGHHEVSSDGKALRFYEVAPFEELLTPERIAEAVRTLNTDEQDGGVNT